MGLYHYTLNIEDQQLIELCREGDAAAQRILYERYVQAMYNRVIRMVADRHLAEDILQEVFLKVFRYLPNFKGDATIGAWIKRIAINTTIEHLRSKRRIDYRDTLPENGVPHPASREDTPKVSMAAIHEAIKQLPGGSRVVLTLYLLEGYQHQEIAQILNISESTSKTQYRRGKLLLQEILKKKLES